MIAAYTGDYSQEIIGKLSGMNPNYIEEQAAILRATVHEEFEPIPQV